MINSWSSFKNIYTEQSMFFNPMISSSTDNVANKPNVNDYQKYGWLFGVK
jgi:hypothetical protein